MGMPSLMLDDSVLIMDTNMSEGQSHRLGSGTAIVYSARCPGKTTPNEDAVASLSCGENRGILAVADGLGGQPAGDRASSTAIKELETHVRQAVEQELELRGGILNGFEHANQAVSDFGIGAATTLAVVEVDGQTIRPYHAGDSSILVTGQRGRLRWQTMDHSPVGYAIEAGLLEQGDALQHEDRHLISNMVGNPAMRIEIGPVIHLQPHDTLLLATDGLTDNVHLDEIVERIRKGPLEKAARALIDLCNERMTHATENTPSKPDDVSFILFRLKA
ncbi:MAG: serine/threonine-protein phosphatase [Phycisphaerae bacterium]|nr:serine/threonine-protein phosphatase [Phycisphaerae bacterium]